ncbi:MAG TPA: hypothetical protein VHN16_11110 [Streptosporangiaceae bacterium]|nr:hypothetical protein [Streptosporangiaceae bacterium]
MGDGTRQLTGDGIQCPLPQVPRWQRRREQARQHGWLVAGGGLDTYLAVSDVPLHPPAQQPSAFPALAGEDSPEFRAVLGLGYDDRQRFQRLLETGARPRGQRLRLVARHAENVGKIGPPEPVSQAQLGNLLVRGVEHGQRRIGQDAGLRVPGNGREYLGVIGCPEGFIELRRRRAAHPELALVAGHREQPRPEPIGIGQPVDAG